jgi:hypothetical protein
MEEELKLKRRLKSQVDLPEFLLIETHGIMCIIIEDSLKRFALYDVIEHPRLLL